MRFKPILHTTVMLICYKKEGLLFNTVLMKWWDIAILKALWEKDAEAID